MICNRCNRPKNNDNYKMCVSCREYHKLYRRKWRIENPGVEAIKAKEYRKRHPERVKMSLKEYAKKHPDIIKRAQQTRNKDKHAEIKRKRRRIKLNAKGSFTQKEFYKLCEAFNYKCLKCSNKFSIGGIYGLVADHIVPLSKNGLDYIFNIQCLCGKCNRQKYTEIIDYRPFIPNFVKEKADEIFNA